MGDLCGWGLLRQYYIYTPQLIKKEKKKERERRKEGGYWINTSTTCRRSAQRRHRLFQHNLNDGLYEMRQLEIDAR